MNAPLTPEMQERIVIGFHQAAYALAGILLADLERTRPADGRAAHLAIDKNGAILTIEASFSLAGALQTKLSLTSLAGEKTDLMTIGPSPG